MCRRRLWWSWRWTHLVVEHEQDGAADAHVARPLHLEAVSLLGGGGSVPLNTKHKAGENNEGDGSLACSSSDTPSSPQGFTDLMRRWTGPLMVKIHTMLFWYINDNKYKKYKSTTV